MWELDHQKCWSLKNWCFQTVVLEKILVSPLDSKEIQSVNPKGNQPWIFIGRTDAEAETPILWPPDVKSEITGKDPDAGKGWRQEEKGMTKDEMVGWHHWLSGHSLSKLWQVVKDKEAWCTLVHGVAESWTWLSDWTTPTHCDFNGGWMTISSDTSGRHSSKECWPKPWIPPSSPHHTYNYRNPSDGWLRTGEY